MPAGPENPITSIGPGHRWTVGEFLARYESSDCCWREFDQDHRPSLITIVVYRYGCPIDVAEDIVQRCLIQWYQEVPKIHHRPSKWLPETPIWPWLLIVCRRLFVDLCRADRRITALPEEAFLELLKTSPLDDPQRVGIARVRLQQTLDCYLRLPPKLREVIELNRIEGVALRKLEMRLNLGFRSISYRLKLADRRLRDCLRGRHGWSEADLED